MTDDFVQALRDAAQFERGTTTRVPLPGTEALFVLVRRRADDSRTIVVTIVDDRNRELARVIEDERFDTLEAVVNACEQAREPLEEYADALREAEARLVEAGGGT